MGKLELKACTETERKRKRKMDSLDSSVPKSVFPSELKRHELLRPLMPDDYIDVFGSDPREKPEYPSKKFKKKKHCEIVEGEKFNVTRLLSNGKRDFLVRNNGDKVKIADLKNKYVVICCFFIPFAYFEGEADVCRLLISAYSKWLSRTENQFEMVVVAKMKKDWVNNEAVFNHFFSAFPCLSIPFYDLESRDNVCCSLGLSSDPMHVTMSGLILDRHHKVVRKGRFTEYLLEYGAAFFPFTDSRVDEIEGEDADLIDRLDSFSDDVISSGEESSSGGSGGDESSSSGDESSRSGDESSRSDDETDSSIDEISSTDEETYSIKPVSLAELFKCNLNYKLQRLRCDEGHEEDPDNVITVSELSKKNCVGVYLCGSGSVMKGLASAYWACKNRNLEFEVVIACLPSNGDPTTFLEDLKHLANECGISSSWWLLPYNEEVNLRLARIRSDVEADKLIIARPNGKSWELRAKSILISFGVKAYPFTWESILEKKKSLNLEQLLGGASQQLIHLQAQKDSSTVADLVNKNTLVFFGCHYNDIINVRGSNDKGKNLELLLGNYPAIKEAGCEVVFVPLDFKLADSATCNCGKMEWLKLPRSAAAKAVSQAYFLSSGWPSAIFAFGKGGRLRSTRAEKYLQDLGSLFADDKVVLEEAKFQRRNVVACLKKAEDAWGMH